MTSLWWASVPSRARQQPGMKARFLTGAARTINGSPYKYGTRCAERPIKAEKPEFHRQTAKLRFMLENRTGPPSRLLGENDLLRLTGVPSDRESASQKKRKSWNYLQQFRPPMAGAKLIEGR